VVVVPRPMFVPMIVSMTMVMMRMVVVMIV
jgi:hypothetical protein